MRNHSRGERHSAAVRRGLLRYRESHSTISTAEQRANQAKTDARVWRGMIALLGKVGVPIPTPEEIETQLKQSWKDGYVRALRDVQREREQLEAQRYYDALPQITNQEVRTISHAYER